MAEQTCPPSATRGRRATRDCDGRAGRRRRRVPTPIAMLLVVALPLVVWDLVVRFGDISPIVFPSPRAVGESIVEVGRSLAEGGFFLEALSITVQEILLGFALASTAGVLLGALVGLTDIGRRAVMPLFVLVEATPKIAFVPMFVAWFGFGMTSKVAMAAFLSFFPVVVGTAAGLAAVSEAERRLFSSLRTPAWRRVLMLHVPRSLPFVFAGLKIAVVSSVTGVIAAEFIGGGSGFGEQIRISSSQLAIDRVFGLIFYLSLLGVLLFGLVSYAQRRLVFWDEGSRRQ
ncbi:ABC transporter permease [Nocardioides sp. L-11A]|uniref:ABC transporter permease n=1 Tax=Nocardioides sp. L-11A TaxID=3043848 RepID=UPI00249B22DE|nr:ABC transporter permease [Nocardioides sp. L-11A]